MREGLHIDTRTHSLLRRTTDVEGEFRSLGFSYVADPPLREAGRPLSMAFRRMPDGTFVALAALEIERIVIQRTQELEAPGRENAVPHAMWLAAANAIACITEQREFWYVLATRERAGADGNMLRTGWIAAGRGRDAQEAAQQCERTLDDIRTIYGGCVDFLVIAPVTDPMALLDLVRPAAAPFVQSFRRRPPHLPLFVSHASGGGKTMAPRRVVREIAEEEPGAVPAWSGRTATWLPLAEALAASSTHAGIVVRVATGFPVPSGAIAAATNDLDRIGHRHQELLATSVREVTLVPHGFERMLLTAGQRVVTLSGPCLAVDVSLATSVISGAGLTAILVSALTAPFDGGMQSSATDTVLISETLESVPLPPNGLLVRLDPASDPALLAGAGEAVTLVRTVDPPHDERSPLPCSRSRILSLREHPPSGTLLGTSEGRGTAQPVRLDDSARFQHVYIVGQTGTGKSTLMLTLALGDIVSGHGVTVLDPHGSLIEAILNRIPESRAGDVMLMAPGASDDYIGLNPLDFQTTDPSEYLSRRDHMIDELLDTFNAFYNMREAGGPMFEQYFRVFMGLVCGTRPPEEYTPVLPMVALTMQNPATIKRLTSRLGPEDPITAGLLRGMMETSGEHSFPNFGPYVTSKLNRFYSSASARRVLCQSGTINYEQMIRDRRILLVRLQREHLGTETSALMARQIVAGLTNAALRRGTREAEPHFIYADEFHTFATERFAMLLSEARKFRLGLVLAHQYTSQLKVRGDQNVLDAVLGNVGTVIAFRVGANDADLLGDVMAPRVTPSDITGLPNFSACVRSVGTLGNIPFALRTTPPPPIAAFPTARAVTPRGGHGLTAAEADAAIAANLEAFRHLDDNSIEGKVVPLGRHQA